MREMKNRLLAIEAELQTLYRETGDESEVSGILLVRQQNCFMWRRLDVFKRLFDHFLVLALVIFHVERLA